MQAAFLIPISVCIYTAAGGLKATFLSSYIHTVFIYVALCIFSFTVYAGGKDLGSPSKVTILAAKCTHDRTLQGIKFTLPLPCDLASSWKEDYGLSR